VVLVWETCYKLYKATSADVIIVLLLLKEMMVPGSYKKVSRTLCLTNCIHLYL
jgi:hypothetical protein